MEETLIALFTNAPYIASFLAGVLTFFSPCVLALVPAYLSYVSGLSIKQLSDEHLTIQSRVKVIEASLLFITGFSIIFVLLGASMANLVEDIFAYEWIRYLAGTIIIIFGLHFMGIISIKFLNYEARANFGDLEKKSTGFWAKFLHKISPFLLGVSFALGWTPCIGPIFTAIISLGAQEEVKSIILMVIYTLGLGIPFLLSALLTNRALALFIKIKKYFRVIEIIGGVLLILIGIGMFQSQF